MLHRHRMPSVILTCLFLISSAGTLYPDDVRILCDFETDADLRLFEMKTGKPSDLHATHGQHSLKVLPGEYLSSWQLPKDWSGYESIDLDAFVEGDAPITGTILIADQAWKDKGSTYWNRANRNVTLKPGANRISLPVQGLYRGEAGSRGNDLTTPIDPAHIVRLDYGFNPAPGVTAIYLDQLRLTKSTRPDGIQAFDFGPDNQSLFPGFTAISWDTVYGAHGNKAGLRERCTGANRARDDTYPTRLFQDYVWFQENGNEFLVDMPKGLCHVWLVFDDCGYWGGEQAQFHTRTVLANGKEVFRDERGAQGPADFLFRFEHTEPKPGDSLWDLYVRDLFKPVRFDAMVGEGPLRIRCEADGTWNTKVAAVIVYPDAIAAEAERFIGRVMQDNRAEFDARAVYLGGATPAPTPPAEAIAQGYWLGFPSLEDTVSFTSAPGAPGTRLQGTGTLGQQLSWTFAIRPLREISGAVTLTASDLRGQAGLIPAASIECRYVHNLTHRESSDLAYTIQPMSVRRLEQANLRLTKDLTRQFWLALTVPESAAAGNYAGTVTLTAGTLQVSIPISLEVLNIHLDDPAFNTGFLGAWVSGSLPPERAATGWLELATMLKRMGMNSFCGGPNIPFSGIDAAGTPRLDFAACDAYFRMLAKAGFTHPVYDYGGPGMVEGLGSLDECRAWAQTSGMTAEALLKTVWGAVEAHARTASWLPIYHGMLDEPRTVEQAQTSLALHQLYRAAVPFVRDGGFYSVNWSGTSPLDATVQTLFKTMAWSGLNAHNQIDMDHAAAEKREVHIYNQGLDRHSFGEFQWAEMRKGVKGRMQWHVLALSGYQFYDLDAREPDPGVINWGRDEIIPTLYAYRCAEGTTDFRVAVTLWNLAHAHADAPDAKAAIAYLDRIAADIPAGQQKRPPGVPGDESFRTSCITYLKALLPKP
jgi:hypothetical protein